MDHSKSIVDNDGNLNASVLSKELKEALDFDVKYKQTDNMKKRAVKVAQSYDEFKAMVSCAHLKKLNRQEVESLSHAKKGWVKSVVRDKSSSAHILLKEAQDDQFESTASTPVPGAFSMSLGGTSKLKKPKSPMEMERDLRRYCTPQEKLQYLSFVGLKRAKSIFAAGADVDLLEQVLRVLIANKDDVPAREVTIKSAEMQPATQQQATAESPPKASESNSTAGEESITDSAPAVPDAASPAGLGRATGEAPTADEIDDNIVTSPGTPYSMDTLQLVRWLKALPDSDKFGLMADFIANDVLAIAVDCLLKLSNDLGVKVEKTVAKYRVGMK